MILVTGGTGFIGREVVKRLLDKGFNVKVLCRRSKKISDIGVNTFLGDVRNYKDVKMAIKNCDTVIHLAGIVSYKGREIEMIRTNILGTKNVVHACLKRSVKIIFSSSVSVYGEIEKNCFARENYRIMPINLYGRTKVVAEKYVCSYGNYVILRFAPIYGISYNWKMILRLFEKLPLPLTEKYTHVLSIRNCVQSIIKSIDGDVGIYNIADKKPLRIMDLINLILKEMGKKKMFVSEHVFNTVARFIGIHNYTKVFLLNRMYSIERAMNVLKYKPKEELRKGIKEIVKWYNTIK